ncbi:MAG: MFS transporter [archaeon]|nr:MAG: MFS transporter [archaeon]
MFGSRGSKTAIGALVAARIVYAVNWLNIGAVYTLMGPDLSGGVGGLGILTSAFYLGLGIFQVPGGLLAAKWGPKKIVTLGVLLSSTAAIGTSASGSLVEVATFRLVVGAGMAFVFAPAVVLVATLMSGRKSGMAAGLFNSAFDVGGIFGLFAWIVIATVTGWRSSLFLSGGLGVATGALVYFLVPGGDARAIPGEIYSKLGSVLRDRRLVLVGLGILGTDIGVTLFSSFAVYYLVNTVRVDPAVAGLVGGSVYGVAIFSTLWGGRVYDRVGKPGLLMLVSNLGVVAAVALSSIETLAVVAAAAVLLGVASSVAFTVGFAAARDFNTAGEKYDSLAIAWVNCIGLFGSFWPPLVFSFLVERVGYWAAWGGGAALSLALTLPLLLLRE